VPAVSISTSAGGSWIGSSAFDELSRLHKSLYDHLVRPELERRAQLADEQAEAARAALQQQQKEERSRKRRFLDKL